MLSAPLPQAESNIFNPQLQQNLQKLIADLHTTSLCNIKDYTGIEFDTLNNYLSNTPLNHPIFGKIQAYITETDGTLFPIRMVVEYRERIAAEIAATLVYWSKWTNIGGRVTTELLQSYYRVTNKKPKQDVPSSLYLMFLTLVER